ncbi:MAG TPA: nickel-dependent lactate racemase [Negativicutes bacterium]|nr:nickel-dependent lactate racemase [Negativicutes bacterium]
MTKISLAYGSGAITAELPAGHKVQVVDGRPTPPVADVAVAVRQALASPIGSRPLGETVSAGDRVAVVASDLTRSLHQELFLPVLLDELNAAGVPDGDITLVVALGAHRRHTPEENAATYGRDVVNRVRIVQSYARDENDFTYVGTTTRGVAAKLSRHVTAADKVILTGGIAYHSMAGFAGGRKSVVPGVASYDTIQANHRFCLSDEIGSGVSPLCDCGLLAGNPLHKDQMEIAAMLAPAFLLNVIPAPDGGLAGFVAGHWRDAWEEGCRRVAGIYGVPIREQTDLVIASAGGYPKDVNFYQATKATENALAACNQGGVVIAVLECRAIGEPPDFRGWFDIASLHERELALRERFTVPGFVALKTGLAARRIQHIIVTLPENRSFIEKAGMTPAATLPEAIALAETRLGCRDYTVTVMPHAAATLPLPAG